MSTHLPDDYAAYIDGSGVSEGFTDGPPGYFQLWHPDEVESRNAAMQVQTLAPGFLGFGSDGGGELLAFDVAGAVFMLPMIGMEPQYAKKIADSWSEVCERITQRA